MGQLWVIEQDPAEGDYPDDNAVDLVSKADVVGCHYQQRPDQPHTGWITGAMLSCTSLSPALVAHGVRILSDSRVIDEFAVTQENQCLLFLSLKYQSRLQELAHTEAITKIPKKLE